MLAVVLGLCLLFFRLQALAKNSVHEPQVANVGKYFSIRADETVLRTDGIVLSRPNSVISWLADLTVTSQRLLFTIPEVSGQYDFVAGLAVMLSRASMPTPLENAFAIRLSEISRFWAWQPEFSGPPAIQVGDDLYYISLWRRGMKQAPIEAVREHFNAMENARRVALGPGS